MNVSGTGKVPVEPVLIERVLAGEKDCFHDLIRPYERGAFVLACSIVRNPDDAEEVVQQAMLKVFAHLAELAEVSKFKAWLFRVVENEAKMYWRRRRQRLSEPIDRSTDKDGEEGPFQPRQFADWRDLPSEPLDREEIRAAIAKVLQDLPEIYREVFVLRDMQRLNVAETAEVLGIGHSAVKTRLHRARLMLREALVPLFAERKPSLWERWKGLNPWLAAKR